MTRRLLLLVSAGLVAAPCVLPAQQKIVSRVRVSSFYESYSFDRPFSLGVVVDSAARAANVTDISELVVPVGIDLSLGQRVAVTVSSGFVKADVAMDSTSDIANQSLSGLFDTEVRLGVDLIPGRLTAVVNGTIPTGIGTVQDSATAVLGALVSDVIGFATSSVGSGGNVGGGFVGAVPLGKLALGAGATYNYPFSYDPVVGPGGELKPGPELRARVGLEGPLGRTTYLKVAGVFAQRQKDVFADSTGNGIGPRIVGYVELSQGFGNMQLTLYGYDVYRSSPQIEPSAFGQAVLPKGNLIVGGFRYAIPVGRNFQIAPKLEYRYSAQAPYDWTTGSYTEDPIEKAGTSLRFGLDLRQQLSRQFALVLTGTGLTGSVVQGGTNDGLKGYRAGLLLEVQP